MAKAENVTEVLGAIGSALGTGYIPTGNELALNSEFQRVPIDALASAQLVSDGEAVIDRLSISTSRTVRSERKLPEAQAYNTLARPSPVSSACYLLLIAEAAACGIANLN